MEIYEALSAAQPEQNSGENRSCFDHVVTEDALEKKKVVGRLKNLVSAVL